MTRSQEIRPDIDEGIDRKVLSQLRARFLKVNDGRLERAMQALSTRQQLVLRLLPLLFHVNHPLLPGYVSGRTPAGVRVDGHVKHQVRRCPSLARFPVHRGFSASLARCPHLRFRHP